jgi:RNA polymerase sigma-70 factor (subfamily 1)
MSLAHESIDALVAAAKAGSSEALGEVLQRFRPVLMKRARMYLDGDLTLKLGESGLVQETFLAAVRCFTDFHGSSEQEVANWLTHILIRRLQDVRKQFRGAKRDVRRERPLTKDVAARLSARQDHFTERDDTREERESDLMRQAFYRLSEDHKEVVRLHLAKKMSFKDVAAFLNCSEQAAQQLWTRAVRLLSKEAGLLGGERRSKRTA